MRFLLLCSLFLLSCAKKSNDIVIETRYFNGKLSSKIPYIIFPYKSPVIGGIDGYTLIKDGYERWYMNGKILIEINYIADDGELQTLDSKLDSSGIRDRYTRMYNENGIIISEDFYVNGVLMIERQFHDNGTINSEKFICKMAFLLPISRLNSHSLHSKAKSESSHTPMQGM